MNYEFLEKLGEGKFGEVWRGQHKKTGEYVAIKQEFSDAPCKMLKHESIILHYLYMNGCNKIPLIYWYGLHEDLPTLIMTHYDISLEQCPPAITLSKVSCYKIMCQMIRIIQSIHQNHIIHRDIKPQNFMMKGDKLYVIDFGLASVFVDDKNCHHPAKPAISTILGTPKYVSVNIHDGLDPSRRDDLISVGYIYMYLACGLHLPWERIPYNASESEAYEENHILHYKNQERKHRKSWTSMQEYCTIIGKELVEYMRILYSMEYADTPDYNTLAGFYKP